MAVQWEAFGTAEAEREEAAALLAERWAETVTVVHAVWLDGEIVAAGTAAATDHALLLFGGATLPSVRGRGAYRALIRARWDEAVARDTPVLATQAGAMSAPILQRLGFERVGAVDILRDDFATECAVPRVDHVSHAVGPRVCPRRSAVFPEVVPFFLG